MKTLRITILENHVRPLWTNACWAMRFAWGMERGLLTGLIAASLLRSIFPAGLALVARGLVNTVAAALDSESVDSSLLWSWLAAGLTFTLIDVILGYLVTVCSQRLTDEFNLRIACDIMAHAAELDVSYFEDPRFQDILERARQNSAQRFTQFVLDLLAAGTNLVQAITLVGILVAIEPLIMMLLIPITVPYLYYQWQLSRKRYQVEHLRVTKRRWARYFMLRLTHEQNVSETKLLGLAPLLIHEFRSLSTEFRDQDRELYWRGFALKAVFALLSIVGVYIAVARVAFRVVAAQMTIGDVAIYGGAAARLRSVLDGMVFAIASTLEQMLYVANLMTFFAIEPKTRVDSGSRPAHIRGDIEFKNVTFTYPGADAPTLKDINLTIHAGETVALVGDNGAGKTTLAKLVAGLYRPDQGAILLDGYDVGELSVEFLHSQAAFVFQGYGRYEATAADNIAYGAWRQLLNDRRQIEKIACMTDIHEMIEAMPQKYDTQLGRMFGEYSPSDGQWQKLAVARAFARKARFLVLDEPTASLDARSEHQLFDHFRQLAQGRTTILISHRFSTVNLADRIVVLEGGRVIEQGTHQQLVDRQGHYASLYKLQQLQVPLSTNGGTPT